MRNYFEIRMELLAPYNTTQNNPHHVGDLLHHIQKMVDNRFVVCDFIQNRYAFHEAIMVHDIGKKDTKKEKDGKDTFYGHAKAGTEIIKNSRKELGYDQLPNKDFDYLLELVLLHDTKYSKMGKINNMINTHQEGFSVDLLCLQVLDILGQSDFNKPEKLEEVKSFASKILKADNITAKETETINKIINLINGIANTY